MKYEVLVLEVLLKRLAKEEVIVDAAPGVCLFLQRVMHRLLECCADILKSEGHHNPLSSSV